MDAGLRPRLAGLPPSLHLTPEGCPGRWEMAGSLVNRPLGSFAIEISMHQQSPPSTSAERGVVMVWAALALMLVGGVVFAGLERSTARGGTAAVGFSVEVQAHEVARAGITDALAWLRRQPNQPVSAFGPTYDLAAEVPLDETEDPSTGIVRTYEIGHGLWARYEVRQGRPMDPFVDLNGNGVYDEGEPFDDLIIDAGTDPVDDHPNEDIAELPSIDDGSADGTWTPALWTRDVGADRGIEGVGAVWRIEARGLVMRRSNENVPLGQGVNRIVAQAVLATEVRRLMLALPAEAALCAPSPGDVTLGARSRIRADEVAVATSTVEGSLDRHAASEVHAATVAAQIPDYADSVIDIFGVEWAGLRSMADRSLPAAAPGFSRTLNDELVVLAGDVHFGPDTPLKGRGLLVVEGNLTVEADTHSFFSGVIYVDGDVVIHAPAFVLGAIVATGTVALLGSGGDFVELEHDADTVKFLLQRLGQYRPTRAIYAPESSLFGAP